MLFSRFSACSSIHGQLDIVHRGNMRLVRALEYLSTFSRYACKRDASLLRVPGPHSPLLLSLQLAAVVFMVHVQVQVSGPVQRPSFLHMGLHTANNSKQQGALAEITVSLLRQVHKDVVDAAPGNRAMAWTDHARDGASYPI
jgi:hypothetical protein